MADLEVWEKFAADPAVSARQWQRHDTKEQRSERAPVIAYQVIELKFLTNLVSQAWRMPLYRATITIV
jgi:hypothetical protein